MASSLPPPSPSATPPTLEAARLARADACPDACGNLETPYRVELTADGFRAYYRCTDCGQFWHTCWKDAA